MLSAKRLIGRISCSAMFLNNSLVPLPPAGPQTGSFIGMAIHRWISPHQRRQSGLKSGGRGSGLKKSIFPGKFPKNFNFLRQFHQKMPILQTNFRKFSTFSGNFTNILDFLGKNWPFAATSGQIILFLFKIHHFRTYFL